MAYTSGFFDAVDLGGGNYDRVYSAATFAHYFSLLVKNGVFPNPSTGMQVEASSNPDMHITVQSGNGWINGYYITIPDDSSESLVVPTADPSLPRIDSVIMGLNYSEREVQLYIRAGTASTNPSAVSLQRDNVRYELELAQISVTAGMSSIPQASITDMRQNASRCGIVTGTIDQIDTTDLFAQYDDAFQTWFADIQSQLSGDVAANLQNQINALKIGKVNVSDKATEAEATTATDNSKWMTPKTVKAAIGTAPDTVLEKGTGDRVNAIQKGFHRRTILNPLWFYSKSDVLETETPLAISPTRTTSAYHTMFFDTKADNGGELIALGTVKSSRSSSDTSYYHPAWGRIFANDAKNRMLPTISYFDYDGLTNYSYDTLRAISDACFSVDNDVILVTHTSSNVAMQYYLLDLKNNVMSKLSQISNLIAFATESYWGYIYQGDYSDRRIYFAPRGIAIPKTYISLSYGASSSYYKLRIAGVVDDKIYLIEPTSYSNWRLDRISWTSGTPSMVSGLVAFDFSAFPWNQSTSSTTYLYPILYDERYAYVYIDGYTGSTRVPCAHVIKIDMSTETTNWSGINPAETLSSVHMASRVYLGSLPNGKAYYYYSSPNVLYTLDKETALISEETPFTISEYNYYVNRFFWGREQVFNWDIGNYLWTGGYLFNPELCQWIKPKAALYTNPLKYNSLAGVITERDMAINSDTHSYGVKFIGTEVTGSPPILAGTTLINDYLPFVDCEPELVLGPYREED